MDVLHFILLFCQNVIVSVPTINSVQTDQSSMAFRMMIVSARWTVL
jgi:hypothetical protein